MNAPLLQVSHLNKVFDNPALFLRRRPFYAIKHLSLTLHKRKTLAIIGKNSSGKSTLAKVVAGLIPPTSGTLRFKGIELTYGDYAFRAKHIRILFQNPDVMFQPHLNVGKILDAPLCFITQMNQAERDKKINQALRLVGLYPDHANMYIHAMSSSQKQRVALARALILNPEILVIDNALASLDASVKIQMMNLLLKIQKHLGISYLYIGQDLGIIKHIADDVLVMDQGEVVEYGETKHVFTDPQSEITKRLIESEFGKILTPSAWYE